jgi:hypothetical protein
MYSNMKSRQQLSLILLNATSYMVVSGKNSPLGATFVGKEAAAAVLAQAA